MGKDARRRSYLNPLSRLDEKRCDRGTKMQATGDRQSKHL